MSAPAALDRPIWSALTDGWATFAEGDARAWRLDRSRGVFGAAADRDAESLAALAALVPEDGELWLVERDSWPVPTGTRVARSARCTQMVADAIDAPPAPRGMIELGDADADDMLALAELTRPGPYVRGTHRLGRFVGVREGGRLVAMAGERMRMAGLAEVSAVCTHPDARGRGLASALMGEVARRMLARGERPFLHAYSDNAHAIGLYEMLGFRRCGEADVTVLVRNRG